jgi:hypothetical protein
MLTGPGNSSLSNGPTNYNCAIVPDMALEGAFDEAVKVVSAVVIPDSA